MLETILTLLAGAILGAIGLAVLGYWLLRRDRKKLELKVQEETKRRKDEKTKYAQVKPRLERAAEITQRQAEIMLEVEQPSKNSLHSRYKNDLISEARKLEEEKRSLLQSIIADGFNPDVTVNTQFGLQKVPLSEYLRELGIETDPSILSNKLPTSPPPPPTEANKSAKVRQVGKFFVIQGGKNDSNN